MDVKKEFKELRTRFEALAAELEAELPFQKQLDYFKADSGYTVIKAECGYVELKGVSGVVIIITGRSGMTIKPPADRSEYKILDGYIQPLFELAKSVREGHDC